MCKQKELLQEIILLTKKQKQLAMDNYAYINYDLFELLSVPQIYFLVHEY